LPEPEGSVQSIGDLWKELDNAAEMVAAMEESPKKWRAQEELRVSTELVLAAKFRLHNQAARAKQQTPTKTYT
jgi:hypothetical protein